MQSGDIRQDWRGERDLKTKNMWQAIQNITSYKKQRASIMCVATLPDELNIFYACFDPLNKASAVKCTQCHSPQRCKENHHECEYELTYGA